MIFTDASQQRRFSIYCVLYRVLLKKSFKNGILPKERSVRRKGGFFRFILLYKSVIRTEGTVIVYVQVLLICFSTRTICCKRHDSSARKVIHHRIRISITQQGPDTNGYQTRAISGAPPASCSVVAKGKKPESEFIAYSSPFVAEFIRRGNVRITWSDFYILDSSQMVTALRS